MNLFDLPLEILIKIVKHYQYDNQEKHRKIFEQLHRFLNEWCYQFTASLESTRESIVTYREICQSTINRHADEIGMLTMEIDHVEYFVKLNEKDYTVYYPELLIVKNRICLLMQGNKYQLNIRNIRPRLIKETYCLGRRASLNIFQFDKLWRIPLGLSKLNIHNVSTSQNINLSNSQGLKELKLSFASSHSVFPTWVAGGLLHLKRLTIIFKADEIKHQSWSTTMYRLPNIKYLEVVCANLKFYNIIRSLGDRSLQYIRFTMRQQHYTTQELSRTLDKIMKPDGFYVLDFV